MRRLSVPERHQLRVARQTLRMSDAMVGVMGGPNKSEAREIIRRLTGKYVRNPLRRRGSRARYRHMKLARKSRFARGSFRVKVLGRRGKKLIIGCPKGAWDRIRKYCRVGTRAVTLLVPLRRKRRRSRR
jgi:alkanesulfonate monooxygenase SsuD/methylene tetrahydromethanopterin reductase-like flavin-dependent oxidoreductase (luciferase family)